jgi:hypothetical protein
VKNADHRSNLGQNEDLLKFECNKANLSADNESQQDKSGENSIQDWSITPNKLCFLNRE